MLKIARVKADEFNEYAHRSDLKDVTPDAVDISALAAAKEQPPGREGAPHRRDGAKRLRMEKAEKEGR
jgi:hypothetical protein